MDAGYFPAVVQEKFLMAKHTPQNDFRKWNEEMAVKYNPELFHGSRDIFIRWIEGARVKRIIRSASGYQGKRVLEVGCGAGNILEKLPIENLFGIDISDYLLKRAGIRLGKKAWLSQGNAESMPFKDGSFDLAICTEVIEHTQNPAVLLASINSVLKPGGKLVISIPNEKLINFLKRLYFAFLRKAGSGAKYEIARKMNEEWHLHEFKLAGFVGLLKKDFKVKRVYRIPFYFLPVRYVISCFKPGHPACRGGRL
ncbi:MAG: methyltransferase domain-containing protein [Candidatus Omnitrophota bacterium]|nr:methyltransferase domain-containing protein [Candidatus Omnitrophota bacterium]